MNETRIVKMYVDQDMSTYEIAENFSTYPNKIRKDFNQERYTSKESQPSPKGCSKKGEGKASYNRKKANKRRAN